MSSVACPFLLSICLSIHTSSHPSVYLSIWAFIHEPSVHESVCPPIFVNPFSPIYTNLQTPVWHSFPLPCCHYASICLSGDPVNNLTTHPSIFLFVYLSIYLPITHSHPASAQLSTHVHAHSFNCTSFCFASTYSNSVFILFEFCFDFSFICSSLQSPLLFSAFTFICTLWSTSLLFTTLSILLISSTGFSYSSTHMILFLLLLCVICLTWTNVIRASLSGHSVHAWWQPFPQLQSQPPPSCSPHRHIYSQSPTQVSRGPFYFTWQ